jgi:hypothetical protein
VKTIVVALAGVVGCAPKPLPRTSEAEVSFSCRVESDGRSTLVDTSGPWAGDHLALRVGEGAPTELRSYTFERWNDGQEPASLAQYEGRLEGAAPFSIGWSRDSGAWRWAPVEIPVPRDAKYVATPKEHLEWVEPDQHVWFALSCRDGTAKGEVVSGVIEPGATSIDLYRLMGSRGDFSACTKLRVKVYVARTVQLAALRLSPDLRCDVTRYGVLDIDRGGKDAKP